MTKHRVADLEGALLDAAVAGAERLKCSLSVEGAEGQCAAWLQVRSIGGGHGWLVYRPSTEWSTGGPIIERERIAINPPDDQPEHLGKHAVLEWSAEILRAIDEEDELTWWAFGPTPLIAAMRAYVASKFCDGALDYPEWNEASYEVNLP